MNTYTPIIGIEIHVELATASKLFCGCKNDPFYAPKPNIYTCPVCLGMPGGLPVPNKKAIEWTILLGLALDCTVSLTSKFDRKHYFYPDLAKGYQISQFDDPFCKNGIVHTENGDVRIHRVHLEEDTGKLQHAYVHNEKMTLVDFNRSGVPLVEIVTEPDIRSSDQAKAFLKKIHQIILYLRISNADMEKGSMRLEPNISLSKNSMSQPSPRLRRASNIRYPISNEQLPKYKVEVKNINSFNFVKKAIDYEIMRQTDILERGEIPNQETRGYVEATSSTISQRRKETAKDYRYFPEPDIPPFRFTKKWIEGIRQSLPELPNTKKRRFQQDYQLTEPYSILITETEEKADYFDNCMSLIEKNAEYSTLTPSVIAKAIINRKQDGDTISPHDLLDELKKKIDDRSVDYATLQNAVETVIRDQTKEVEEYRKGKKGILMFLIGQTLKKLMGKGDAKQIENLLKEAL